MGISQDEEKPEEKSSLVCRDFLRNVCHRGERCKFVHSKEIKDAEETVPSPPASDRLMFCNDFQNRTCTRPNCKFIHCTAAEKERFKENGALPPRVLESALKQGLPPDLLGITGRDGVPLCKDFWKGECKRGGACKFEHLTAEELESELRAASTSTKEGLSNEMGNGINFVVGLREKEQLIHSGHCQPRRREHVCCGTIMVQSDEPTEAKRRHFEASGPSGTYGHPLQTKGPLLPTPPSVSDIARKVEEENMELRAQIGALKKQVSDLRATNEFLLDQNAHLRLSRAQHQAATAVTVNATASPVSAVGPMAISAGPPLTAGTVDLSHAMQGPLAPPEHPVGGAQIATATLATPVSITPLVPASAALPHMTTVSLAGPTVSSATMVTVPPSSSFVVSQPTYTISPVPSLTTVPITLSNPLPPPPMTIESAPPQGPPPQPPPNSHVVTYSLPVASQPQGIPRPVQMQPNNMNR